MIIPENLVRFGCLMLSKNRLKKIALVEYASDEGRIFKTTLDAGNQRKSIIVHAYEVEAFSGSLQVANVGLKGMNA